MEFTLKNLFRREKNLTVIEATFFGMIFLMPLVFYTGGFDMYEVPKSILLKIGVSLMVIWGLGRAFLQKKITVYMSREQLWMLIVFLLILAWAMVYALRPEASFFGSYFRQGGVYNMLHYMALFVIGLQVLQKSENQMRLMKVVAGSGVIVAAYGVIQHFGLDIFSESAKELFAGRSFSTLGNPTMMGAYLLFPISAFLGLIVVEWKGFLFHKRNRKVLIYMAGLLLLLGALVLTRNRASMLALIGGGGLLFLYSWRKNVKAIVAIVLLGALSVGLFGFIYGKDMRSLRSRLTTWDSTVQMIKDNPIQGYGPESFSFVFEYYAHPDFFEYEDYKNLVDRPHNEFFEMWVHYGIAGALFYIWLIWFVLESFFTRKNPLSRFAALGAIMLILSNMFSFSLVTHYTLLAVFLALISAGGATKGVYKNEARYKLTSILMVALMLPNICFQGCIFNAGVDLLDGYLALNGGEIEIARAKFNDSVEKMPYYDFQQFAFEGYYLLTNLTLEPDDFNRTVEIHRRSKELSLGDTQSFMNEARLYSLKQEYDAADQIYRSLYEQIGPNPLALEHWANMYADMGKYSHAAAVYDELFAILPDHWKIDLAADAEVSEEARIFWKNHPNFINTLQRALESYERSGSKSKAKELYEALN